MQAEELGCSPGDILSILDQSQRYSSFLLLEKGIWLDLKKKSKIYPSSSWAPLTDVYPEEEYLLIKAKS